MTRTGVYNDPDYMKKYRKRTRPKRNEYLREWRSNNRDKVKGYNLKRLYGLSHEEFISMVEERQSKCDLCNQVCKLHVDHCHSTNRIRGLLCTNCNTALGKLGDTVESLQKVLRYLNG